MTTRKLYHPLWAHLPAVALLVVTVVATVHALPLPARAPVHFDLAGRPNGYGSPLLVSIFVIALGVFYLVISALGDEQWARHEEAKRELYADAMRRGGVITGEHGVGLAKRSYLEQNLGPRVVSTMVAIKHALDPKGILNPGKVLPDR